MDVARRQDRPLRRGAIVPPRLDQVDHRLDLWRREPAGLGVAHVEQRARRVAGSGIGVGEHRAQLVEAQRARNGEYGEIPVAVEPHPDRHRLAAQLAPR